jgi:Rrf2 family protein
MAGLLNVGEMGALALHVMVELAALQDEDPSARRTATQLAGELSASIHTLQKVLRRLVMGKLLEPARGVNGGVRLAEKAEATTILAVLECVEGPMQTNGCLFIKRVCDAGARCRFHSVTESLEQSVREHFTSTTIADLARAPQ